MGILVKRFLQQNSHIPFILQSQVSIEYFLISDENEKRSSKIRGKEVNICQFFPEAPIASSSCYYKYQQEAQRRAQAAWSGRKHSSYGSAFCSYPTKKQSKKSSINHLKCVSLNINDRSQTTQIGAFGMRDKDTVFYSSVSLIGRTSKLCSTSATSSAVVNLFFFL